MNFSFKWLGLVQESSLLCCMWQKIAILPSTQQSALNFRVSTHKTQWQKPSKDWQRSMARFRVHLCDVVSSRRSYEATCRSIDCKNPRIPAPFQLSLWVANNPRGVQIETDKLPNSVVMVPKTATGHRLLSTTVGQAFPVLHLYDLCDCYCYVTATVKGHIFHMWACSQRKNTLYRRTKNEAEFRLNSDKMINSRPYCWCN